MGRVDHPAADVQRRAHDLIHARPLERVHSTDDIDDRVESADLVQMDTLDGHLVDRRLDLREFLKQRLRAIPAGGGQCRAIDQAEDFRKRSMRMMRVMRAAVIMVVVMGVRVRVIV